MISQCARRFEELKNAGVFPRVDNQSNALTEGSASPSEGLTAPLDAEEEVETGGSQSSSKVTGQTTFVHHTPADTLLRTGIQLHFMSFKMVGSLPSLIYFVLKAFF